MQPASTFMIRNRLVSSLIPSRAMNSLRLSLRHCTEEDWASSVIFIKIHMGAGQIAYSPSSSPCLKAVYKTMYFILLPSSAWMQDSLSIRTRSAAGPFLCSWLGEREEMRNGGAVHKNREAPRRFETGDFRVSKTQSLVTHPWSLLSNFGHRRISFRRLMEPSYLHMQTIPIPARHK